MTVSDKKYPIEVIIKKSRRKNQLATAIICLHTEEFGSIEIKGFTLWESQHLNPRFKDYVNITPPSIRYFKGYYKLVFIQPIDKWNKLEDYLYMEFKKAGVIPYSNMPEFGDPNLSTLEEKPIE